MYINQIFIGNVIKHLFKITLKSKNPIMESNLDLDRSYNELDHLIEDYHESWTESTKKFRENLLIGDNQSRTRLLDQCERELGMRITATEVDEQDQQ